jgi:hypothetical protein
MLLKCKNKQDISSILKKLQAVKEKINNKKPRSISWVYSRPTRFRT